MGEDTGVEWAHHTFNSWWGCRRVSEECRFCYAETLAKRFGLDIWGSGPRRVFGDAHWNEPLKWNRKAKAAGTPARVFCCSMADVFENHPDLTPHRERLWDLVAATPWLVWMLLTKRPENVADMVPWGQDWPSNVWLGTTAGSQDRAEERIPVLLAHPAVVRFVSYEPALGPADFSRWLGAKPGIDWLIAGGESGAKARSPHPDWFRSARDQARRAGVPYWFKQWGAWAPTRTYGGEVSNGKVTAHRWQYKSVHLTPDNRYYDGSDNLVWQAGTTMIRLGKKRAGKVLDGEVINEVPTAAAPVAA